MPSSFYQSHLLPNLRPHHCRKVVLLCVLGTQMEMRLRLQVEVTMVPSSWSFCRVVAWLGPVPGTGAGSLWCPPQLQWQQWQQWQQQKQQQQQSVDLVLVSVPWA